MKNLILIPFALLSIFLASCQKDSGPTTVSGYVLEEGTNKPIPDATVYILEQKAEYTGTVQPKVIFSTRSTSDGRYSMSFDANKDNLYFVQAAHDTFFTSAGSGWPVNAGKKNTIHIGLTPYGWINFHVVNQTRSYSFIIVNDNSIGKISGYNVDSTFIRYYHGNNWREVYYVLFKNSQDTLPLKVSKNIWVVPHDTVNVSIEY